MALNSLDGLSPAELKKLSEKHGWFHSIDLGDGHWTKGHKSPERMHAELTSWRFPDDLTGKTVLDIGCACGGYSIEALRRGATQVVSIDEQMNSGMRFFLENKVFPLDFRQIDLFSNEFMSLPKFDVIIFAGVLYHVHDVLEALKRVRSKVNELVVLETHINESFGVLLPYMIFYEHDELGHDPTNWWGPNLPCLNAMLRTAGFTAEQTFVEYENQSNARASFLLRPTETSVYAKIISSATGTNSMIEEYTGRIAQLHRENESLRRQLAERPIKSSS